MGSWGQRVVTQYSRRARPMAGRGGEVSPVLPIPAGVPQQPPLRDEGTEERNRPAPAVRTGQQLAPRETASPSPEPGGSHDGDEKLSACLAGGAVAAPRMLASWRGWQLGGQAWRLEPERREPGPGRGTGASSGFWGEGLGAEESRLGV